MTGRVCGFIYSKVETDITDENAQIFWTSVYQFLSVQSSFISRTAREKGKEEEITIMKCNYRMLWGANTHVVRSIRPNFTLPRWVLAHTYCTKERLCQFIPNRLCHHFAASVTLKNSCTWTPAKSNPTPERRIQKIISLYSSGFPLSSS